MQQQSRSLVQAFAQAVQTEDGVQASQFLKITNNAQPVAALRKLLDVNYMQLLQLVPSPWDAVLSSHLEVLRALQQNDYHDIFVNLEEELKSVAAAIRSEGAWTLPVLYTVCLELRNAAVEADRNDSSGKSEHLQGAGRNLNSAFSLLNDRKPAGVSKKRGSMRIINIMFDVYFRLNNYRLCTPLTKILEGPGYMDLDEYPISHTVTYRFYTGRLHLFDGEYEEAERDLSMCFNQCSRQYVRNKRTALIFLVPAKLMTGKLPKPQLLQKYRLPEYGDITVAVQRGDLALFNRSFAQWEALFRRRGLYLLLERLKWFVYRKLFKRAFYMVVQAGSFVCSIDVLQCALGACNVTMESEEVECIVANLINLKFIRGYMAFKKDKTFLIVSQKEPFPPLSK